MATTVTTILDLVKTPQGMQAVMKMLKLALAELEQAVKS